MRLHRFIKDIDIKLGVHRIKDGEILNQFKNVLKFRIGERVVICDGRLNEGTGEIIGYGKDYVEINILELGINKNEPDKNVILYCSILKKESFELVVQKATEAGIKEIVPVITDRTVKLDIRKDRLEKIIKEAAEQSGRGIVPVLRNPMNFEKAVADIGKDDINFLFDSSGESFGSLSADQWIEIENHPFGIWIGPEGGWAGHELQLTQKSEFKTTNLGKLTLRAETAAIVASYLVVHSALKS